MAIFETRSRGDALEDLLERERAAVLAGRFDLLERLSAEKERLLQALADAPADADTLERLRRLGRRNHGLLQAMGRGIERARARTRAAAGQTELRTYDNRGRLSAPVPAEGRLQRKA